MKLNAFHEENQVGDHKQSMAGKSWAEEQGNIGDLMF